MANLSSIPIALARVKTVWNTWNIRTFMVVSFTLQWLIILVVPFRKQTSNPIVLFFVWAAYLLADSVASQAIGLISQHVNNTGSSSSSMPDADLLAFWAPFLLLHLGAPDNITALSIEDILLWVRSLIPLISQLRGAIAIQFQPFTVSSNHNMIRSASFLILASGFIKYFERLFSLLKVFIPNLRQLLLKPADPGPNYATLMEAYDSSIVSGLPARFITTSTGTTTTIPAPSLPDSINDIDDQLVGDAHQLFHKYKGLYAGFTFSSEDRMETRAYFLGTIRTSEQAFRVIGIELNLTYDFFYTKSIFSDPCFPNILRVYRKIFRVIAFLLQLTSLVIWCQFVDKKLKSTFHPYDLTLTYTLLVGAIAVDVVFYLSFNIPDCNNMASHIVTNIKKLLWMWFPQRRWSESIQQFNLVAYSVDPWGMRTEKFIDFIGIKDFLDGFFYVSEKRFNHQLRDLIFNELKHKSELAEDLNEAKVVCAARGDWVLRSMASPDFDPFLFYQWTINVQYDKSLLLWHIATELCYHQDDSVTTETNKLWYEKILIGIFNSISTKLRKVYLWCSNCFSKIGLSTTASNSAPGQNEDPTDYRELCKTLSDYMLYLLIRQADMMSPVSGMIHVRYRDTSVQAKKLLKTSLHSQNQTKLSKKQRHQEACKTILEANPANSAHDDPIREKITRRHKNKSVLSEACLLSRKLRALKDENAINYWEVIAKVWVEMLCYAAVNCKPMSHVAQLKDGGQLVTFVWLLMTHFGLGNKFYISRRHARTKLLINK